VARRKDRWGETAPGQYQPGLFSTDPDGSSADDKAEKERAEDDGPGLFSTRATPKSWDGEGRSEGLAPDGILASSRSKDQSDRFEKADRIAHEKQVEADKQSWKEAAEARERNSRLTLSKSGGREGREKELAAISEAMAKEENEDERRRLADEWNRLQDAPLDPVKWRQGYRHKPGTHRQRQREIYQLGNGTYVKTKRPRVAYSQLMKNAKQSEALKAAGKPGIKMSVRAKFSQKVTMKPGDTDDFWAEDDERSVRMYGNGIDVEEFNRRLFEPDESMGDTHWPGDLGGFAENLANRGVEGGRGAAGVEEFSFHFFKKP
jgi:hypothetical protein